MFNDIDQGTNAMPCDMGIYSTTTTPYSTPNCTATYSTFGVADNDEGLGILNGYSAGAGYDLATGLGSLNVANVVNGWTATGGTATATVGVSLSATTLASSVPLTVTVTVTGSGSLATGSVILSGGGYTSPWQTLSGGAFVFTVPANSLSGGTDTLTVSYFGDTNYAAATNTATVTVTQPTYALTATSPASISAGSSATSTVSLSSTNSYTGTVTFTSASCTLTTSPTGAVSLPTCALGSGGSITITNGTPGGTASFTVSTTSASSAALPNVLPGINRRGMINSGNELAAADLHHAKGGKTGWFQGTGGAALAAFLLFLVPGRMRRWRKAFGALLILATVGFVSIGCGGGSGGSTTGNTSIATTSGTYVFTVTGTGSPAVSPSPSATFTVVVK
jgi:hypothetical protein